MILKLWPSNGNKIKMGMYKLWKGKRKKKIIDWYRFRLIKSSYILFQEWQYVFILLLQALWTLLEYENIITVFLDQQNYLKDY